MTHTPDNDRSVRFVARHYREGALDSSKAWDKFSSRHGIRSTSFVFRYWVGAAAVMLLLLGVGSVYYINHNTEDWQTVYTDSGQMKDVFLPDSTLVALAENSSLRYDRKQYGKEGRIVELKGKAFFKVKSDVERPFSVQTSFTTTKVLGTSFQLLEDSGTTHLHVETGKVSFTATKGTEPLILTAGMSAVYKKEEGVIHLIEENDPNTLSWRTRHLQFRETPVSQVARDLENAYGIKIDYPASAASLKLTAYFDDMSLEDILLIIGQTLDVRLEAVPK